MSPTGFVSFLGLITQTSKRQSKGWRYRIEMIFRIPQKRLDLEVTLQTRFGSRPEHQLILSGIFRGFSQCLKANATITPWLLFASSSAISRLTLCSLHTASAVKTPRKRDTFFLILKKIMYIQKWPRQCPSGPLEHILINISQRSPRDF
jgi:hypothetical protein